MHVNPLRSVSDHNKKVQAFIIGEIVSQPDSKVTEDVAKSKLNTDNTSLDWLLLYQCSGSEAML